ncbi:hypothetical protein [Cupriavidus pinatubonensis]|uniref:PASTA domain-containing protein n=1 Tax=Cupriavidus pinatubonensis TaxID=248026 RepID=A0ABN7ZD61_9BURK|nr:hypothetical protein [Cupriavidus pinatubonensis]CAG9183909.1 hypothetical protein LMG23994_05261 [Cupriavidus pinatubonensis]
MASKLTRYLMSQRCQDVIGHGVEQAVARTRAAGLTPAGDPTILPSARPSTTVIVEAFPPAKPVRKIGATLRREPSDDPNAR